MSSNVCILCLLNSFAADFLALSAWFLGVKIWKQAIPLTFVNTVTIIANGTEGTLSTLVANGTGTVSTIVANGTGTVSTIVAKGSKRVNEKDRASSASSSLVDDTGYCTPAEEVQADWSKQVENLRLDDDQEFPAVTRLYS